MANFDKGSAKNRLLVRFRSCLMCISKENSHAWRTLRRCLELEFLPGFA